MFFKSLFIKINLTILSVFIIVLFLFNAVIQNRLKDDVTEFTKRQALYLTEILKRNIRIDMLGYCGKTVQKIVDQMGSIPGVKTLRIFDNSGIIKYSIDFREVGKTLDEIDIETANVAKKDGDERFAPFEEKNKLYRSFCVIEDIIAEDACSECHTYDEDKVIASINLCMTMEHAENQIKRNQDLSYELISIIIVIVTLVLSLLLAFLVRKPIKKILNTMNKAADGDLDVRVHLKTKDELGMLADQFNSMLAKLAAANKDIEKFHQEQLLRVGRLASVGEMAAGIAHEIKNPLAGLAGAAQILEKEYKEDDSRKEIIREMLKLIKRLDKIIKDLLSFSRETKLEFIVCNLNEEIDKVLFFVKTLAGKANVVISNDLDTAMPRILMDPERIQQVFLNIALNAIQAMTRGGTLNISTATEEIVDETDVLDTGTYVVITFKDSGEGIPKKILQTIFKPFFTTKTQGTGLGLSISQKIIEEHRGKILIESKEGIGTKFKVYLPKRYSE